MESIKYIPTSGSSQKSSSGTYIKKRKSIIIIIYIITVQYVHSDINSFKTNALV